MADRNNGGGTGGGTSQPRVRLRPIALPAEHGSWGLVLEPVVLGLLVAPSWEGLLLSLGVVAAFLTRRPLKVIQVEWGRAHSRRWRIAWRFALGYGVIAVVGVVGTVALVGFAPMVPLVGVIPLLAAFLAYDFTRQSRSWQAEMAGSVAFAAVAASIPMIGGWPLDVSLALSVVIVARAVPSVLYVRARLRLEKDKPRNVPLVVGAHVLGLLSMWGLVYGQLLPALVLAPFLILLVRAGVGLSPVRRRVRVNTIGFMEIGFGLLTILSVVIGVS
jgi:hypothetical protein